MQSKKDKLDTNPKLVYLEWEDACALPGWKDQDEIQAWIDEGGLMVKQCGWILCESKTHISMASRKSDEDNYWMQYGNLQKIPKTWIRKRIDLSQAVCPKPKQQKKK
jgi:hypothetical protein